MAYLSQEEKQKIRNALKIKKSLDKEEDDHNIRSSSPESEDVDFKKVIHPLGYYIHDREQMIEEIFSIIKDDKLRKMIPPVLKNFTLEELKADCLVRLLGMSRKRIMAIIEGRELNSSSDSESESSTASEPDEAPKSPTTKVESRSNIDDDDLLDISISEKDVDSLMKDKPPVAGKAKRPKARLRKKIKTEKDVSLFSIVISDDDLEGAGGKKAKKANRERTSAKPDKAADGKGKRRKRGESRAASNAARAAVPSGDDQTKSAAGVDKNDKGKTLLEILELEMRARAIRALLKNTTDAEDAAAALDKPSAEAANPQLTSAIFEAIDQTLSDKNLATEPNDESASDDDVEIIDRIDLCVTIDDDDEVGSEVAASDRGDPKEAEKGKPGGAAQEIAKDGSEVGEPLAEKGPSEEGTVRKPEDDAVKGKPTEEDAAGSKPADTVKGSPTKGDAVKSKPAGEGTVKSKPTVGDAAGSKPADTVKGSPTKGDAVKSKPAEEGTVKSKPTNGDAARSKPAENDSVKSKPTNGDAVRSKPAEDAVKSKSTKENAVKSKSLEETVKEKPTSDAVKSKPSKSQKEDTAKRKSSKDTLKEETAKRKHSEDTPSIPSESTAKRKPKDTAKRKPSNDSQSNLDSHPSTDDTETRSPSNPSEMISIVTSPEEPKTLENGVDICDLTETSEPVLENGLEKGGPSANSDESTSLTDSATWSERWAENKNVKEVVRNSKICASIRKRMRFARMLKQKQSEESKQKADEIDIGDVEESSEAHYNLIKAYTAKSGTSDTKAGEEEASRKQSQEEAGDDISTADHTLTISESDPKELIIDISDDEVIPDAT